MATPVLQEASTVSVLEASEAFFQNRPTDTWEKEYFSEIFVSKCKSFLVCFSRFENVSIIRYQSTSSAIGADGVDFELPRQTTNLFYMWPEHTLEVHMRMVKKSDGKAIDGSALVAPVNNVIFHTPKSKYVN